MNNAYLLLGANLGNRSITLKKAQAFIAESIGKIKLISSVYETKAWGVTEQPDFLNLVLMVETNLSPNKLLESLQKIEFLLGRKRKEKWHARTIDIDILFYNDLVINLQDLKIPHPAITERKFTLAPLAEICPDLEHPLYQKNITQLLYLCKDELEVWRYIR
ncbi:MAG: 2-amino-4-hydroxy-6-hydroxymethyldihydropteridine diphosphokinase [Bacteroidota bacterium]